MRSPSPFQKAVESARENPAPASAADLSEPPQSLIQPAARWSLPNLAEVWRYRDLLALLVWRDFSARYRQSVIGVGWAVLRPLTWVLVFTIVFGVAARLPSDGLPYPAFSLAGLIPWMYFSGCLTAVSGSLVAGQGLLTKVYFPRLILPLTGVVGGLADLGVQTGMLLAVMAWYGIAPGWQILAIPLFVLQTMLAVLAVGLWLTVLHVRYRDVGHAVPFLLQLWMWLTPVAYAHSMIPQRWKPLYGLNPLVAAVEGFRWATLGQGSPDPVLMSVSGAVMAILLVTGLVYFARAESTFADVI